MTEKAKAAAEALRMLAECNGNPCGECVQAEYEGRIACSDLSKTLFSIAALLEEMAAELEMAENKLSELLYYVTGGRYSKTDYSTDDMRRFVDDYLQSVCNECDDLEAVKLERDAAIKALTLWPCFTCDNVHKPACLDCIRNRVRILQMRGQFMRDSYVWRGLCKENGGTDHED